MNCINRGQRPILKLFRGLLLEVVLKNKTALDRMMEICLDADMRFGHSHSVRRSVFTHDFTT